MKHVFIINPTAGKSDSRQKIYDMAEKLRQEHGLEVQCLLTKKQGHATEIARRLCQSGEELRFYACGGDGTVNEVANGIIGYDNAAMTVIPVGTGNDFLKNFGPEDMEKFRDAENLWDAPQFPIDAIDVNGRIALTIACSGLDARVAKDVHNFSESPILDGKSSYIVSLMVNFLFKGIGSHWTVELDGEAVEDDYALVAVCNGLEVQIELSSRRFMGLKARRRALAGRTGCGVCGVEQLNDIGKPVQPLPFTQSFDLANLDQALAHLNDFQPVGRLTGCTHAAAWVRLTGELAGGFEDVGRHVALDKLLGRRAEVGEGWQHGAVLVSSRASYEMVQKAAMCGVEILFAVSAATTLAVEVAERCNLTLVGFCKPGRATVYTHPQRLIAG